MTEEAIKLLVNRKIIRVKYLDDDTLSINDWYKRPIIIHLDDGSFFIPMKDDEGNDGGSLYYEKGETTTTIPTIS